MSSILTHATPDPECPDYHALFRQRNPEEYDRIQSFEMSHEFDTSISDTEYDESTDTSNLYVSDEPINGHK